VRFSAGLLSRRDSSLFLLSDWLHVSLEMLIARPGRLRRDVKAVAFVE
jgi:hypothetical protein